MIKNLLIKNNTYDGVRAVIQASQSGVNNYYYTEARGDRYYYSITGSTQSPRLESVNFNAYLSFTMSGAVTYTLDIIPMNAGETCFLDVQATAVNANCTKAYIAKAFGGFRHSGSTLAKVQNQIDITNHSDFSSHVAMDFSAAGTQSVRMILTGVAAETLDWDIYLKYTKGYHTLTTGGGGGGSTPTPWYPVPPSA
jgi:hypothetical protein